MVIDGFADVRSQSPGFRIVFDLPIPKFLFKLVEPAAKSGKIVRPEAANVFLDFLERAHQCRPERQVMV